jgi:hypothetical protein
MMHRLILMLVVVIGGLVASGGLVSGADALYPDLRTEKPTNLHFDQLSDGTHVLRFSNTVWNAGEGRLELEGNPHPQQDASKQIYQNLYDAPIGGTQVSHTVVASDLIDHPGHEHYHFANFASYLLLEKVGGHYVETTKKGTKTSFCIMDTTRVSGSYPSQYTSCGRELQGLSVGWGDTYSASLPDQWIVLGSQALADGEYAIQSTADPKDLLDEGGRVIDSARESNNTAITYFTVSNGQIGNVRNQP